MRRTDPGLEDEALTVGVFLFFFVSICVLGFRIGAGRCNAKAKMVAWVGTQCPALSIVSFKAVACFQVRTIVFNGYRHVLCLDVSATLTSSLASR